MAGKPKEHWSSEVRAAIVISYAPNMSQFGAANPVWLPRGAYQNSASFVPKLATKVLGWLDVQPDDLILDIGCGDGVLNLQIAETLKQGHGKIHGTDFSEAMIRSSKEKALKANLTDICTFEVIDATKLIHNPELQKARYDKVFSNAAMHWILRHESGRRDMFTGVYNALKPSGTFVFEMGGMGNCGEMRSTLLAVISRRIGIEKAREVDPWFFPDESWMSNMLEQTGFKVDKIEREYRPTKADVGGIEGWVRLMGKQFFDAVKREDREECEKEACDILKSVCASPGGGDWIGYVRLRAVAKRI